MSDEAWNLIQQFITNPLTALISFATAIVGIPLSIFLYIKSKKERQPRFRITSSNLISDFSNKFDKLKIVYGEQRIQNLTVSKIAFWNDGKETINLNDIAEADPLQIKIKSGCNILDINVIAQNNPPNKFDTDLNKQGDSASIVFDFLDKGQGGVIQIIHTGKESEDLEIVGTVKGAGKPQLVTDENMLARKLDSFLNKISPPLLKGNITPFKRRHLLGYSFIFAGIVMILLIQIISRSLSERLLSLAFLPYLYFGWSLLKRRVPKGLEMFENEL